MLIVDRLEENMAVIEYGDGTFQMPLSLLPAGLKAGDVLRLLVEIDKDETEKRRSQIKTVLSKLWEES